jgi:hypothetical protein
MWLFNVCRIAQIQPVANQKQYCFWQLASVTTTKKPGKGKMGPLLGLASYLHTVLAAVTSQATTRGSEHLEYLFFREMQHRGN